MDATRFLNQKLSSSEVGNGMCSSFSQQAKSGCRTIQKFRVFLKNHKMMLKYCLYMLGKPDSFLSIMHPFAPRYNQPMHFFLMICSSYPPRRVIVNRFFKKYLYFSIPKIPKCPKSLFSAVLENCDF